MARLRRKLTWFLAAQFAALCFVGEGLHLLPGFAHAVRLGSVLSSSVTTSCARGTEDAGNQEQFADAEQDGGLPFLDPGECPVCRHFSQTPVSDAGVDIVAPTLSAQTAPEASLPQPALCPLRSFLARAPPIA